MDNFRGGQMFVRCFGGGGTATVDIEHFAKVTVKDLKRKIQKKKGIPFPLQRLIFAGKQLDNHRLLSDYNIRRETTVSSVPRLAGLEVLVCIDKHIDFQNKQLEI